MRREFEQSENFPDYMIPFVLTADEAKAQLVKWAERSPGSRESRIIKDHIDEIQGYYLSYALVRGLVNGYVSRENIRRRFDFRGFI